MCRDCGCSEVGAELAQKHEHINQQEHEQEHEHLINGKLVRHRHSPSLRA